MPTISLNTAKIYLSRLGIPYEVVEYMYDYHMKIELEKAFANSLHDISIRLKGNFGIGINRYLSKEYIGGEYGSIDTYGYTVTIRQNNDMLAFVRYNKGNNEYFDDVVNPFLPEPEYRDVLDEIEEMYRI